MRVTTHTHNHAVGRKISTSVCIHTCACSHRYRVIYTHLHTCMYTCAYNHVCAHVQQSSCLLASGAVSPDLSSGETGCLESWPLRLRFTWIRVPGWVCQSNWQTQSNKTKHKNVKLYTYMWIPRRDWRRPKNWPEQKSFIPFSQRHNIFVKNWQDEW